jgi:curved DNA-binding protein CbpA
MNDDLYSVLGVLPDAEDVVIRSAYRALAQRYHPDKSGDNSGYAKERMTSINRAYEVLGDPVKRSAYNKRQESVKQGNYSVAYTDEYDSAFSNAFSEKEDKWNLACKVYEDLDKIRCQLQKISPSLAYSYVVILLEGKNFSSRRNIAIKMEKEFLKRYFGDNKHLIRYAKALIIFGKREAARELNKYATVLGKEANPSLIIAQIEKDFPIGKLSELIRISDKCSQYCNLTNAVSLCEAYGYTVRKESKGIFREPVIHLKGDEGNNRSFESERELWNWVKENLVV